MVSSHLKAGPTLYCCKATSGKIPPLKFFTKQQLIWVHWNRFNYVLGFPYVKRVSKAQIKANPNLRNADRDNIAEACKGFKNHPTSILNFWRGTRRTSAKQLNQSSDYKNLLKPKIGIEYVIKDMGDYLHKLIDVTIVYPDGTPTFWQFVKRRMQISKVCRLPSRHPKANPSRQ